MSFEESSDSNNVCWKNLKSLGSKQNATLCKLFPDLKAAQPLAPFMVGWGRSRVEKGLDLRSITAREVMAVAEEQGSPEKESHSVAPKHLGTKDFTSSQQPACFRTTNRAGEGQSESLWDSWQVGSSTGRGQQS